MLVDTFNRVIGPGDAAFAVATCRPLESVAGAAARLAPGLRLTDMPDYFSWTMPLLEEPLRTGDAATLHRAAIAMVDGWHPAVRRMVSEADIGATFPVGIASARPVRPWDTANVTLLGDAIHTMSPGRGDGASIALKDAQLLRDARVEAVAGHVPLKRTKARYEAQMLSYGFQAVADSLRKPFGPPSQFSVVPAPA